MGRWVDGWVGCLLVSCSRVWDGEGFPCTIILIVLILYLVIWRLFFLFPENVV